MVITTVEEPTTFELIVNPSTHKVPKGARPGELPMEQPTPFDSVMASSQREQDDLPSLLRADEVIP